MKIIGNLLHWLTLWLWGGSQSAKINVDNFTSEKGNNLDKFSLKFFEEIVGKLGNISWIEYLHIKQRYYLVSPYAQNLIEPWISAWSPPILLLNNKDNSYFLERRKFTKVSKLSAHLFPTINSIWDKSRKWCTLQRWMLAQLMGKF